MQRSLLTKLGLSWISARSKHPKQDKEAQALYKKLQSQVGEKWVSDDCSYLCKGL
jgi:hypothetical protein